MSTRTSKAEKEIRVTQVLGLLIRGVKRSSILQYASEKTNWSVTDRTVDNYIEEATEIIRNAAVIDRDYEIGQGKIRLDDLYMKTMNNGDYRTALAVQRERAAMLGLNAPQKIEQENSGITEIHVRYIDEKKDNGE